MSLRSWLRRRSIDRRLLLLITGLLVATVSAFWWAGYQQVERVALTSAGERLMSAAAPIRGMLEENVSRHRQELQRIAADPVIVQFLRSGAGRERMAPKLRTLRSDANPVRLQLRDVTGKVVFESVDDGVMAGSGWIERSIREGKVGAGGTIVSAIWADGQRPYSETLTPITGPRSPAATEASAPIVPLGYLSEVRPLVAQGLETVRALIGPEAVMLVGAPGEGTWTDLEHPTRPAPSNARAGESLAFDSPSWGAGVGALTPIRGSPWMLWVHQPRALILAPTERLMTTMALLALLFVVAGALSAWMLGRRITKPIIRLTNDAELLATAHAVKADDANGDKALDEIERLAEAFGRMSARVQESHDALAASERRFRALIENASDQITIVDADGMVVYATPAHQRVLGHAPGELVHHPITRHADPEDQPTLHEILRDLRGNHGATVAVRCRMQHQNGSWRVLAGSATNLLLEPSIQGIVLNWHDVTEQAALEVQLRDAQRMEAVGRLAGGIAHDLNNILTAVTSFSQFAADALPAGSHAREDVEQVEIAAQRATALTRQLLAFSRQQVLKPRPLNLNEVVAQLEVMLRRLIRADVTLRTELAPNLGQIFADPVQIEQVVLNLVLNARDAMPNGGTIHVRTDNVELTEDDVRPHQDAQPGAHVMLSVSDSGFGINEETMSHIFEPFFTTKAIGHGTGLGLSTVYGITRQSGGSIAIHSIVGEGSTFTLYFPRHTGTMDDPVEESAMPLRELEAATILLVEDDLSVQRVARRVLEGAGYDVHSASNGKEALGAADRLPKIDLLVTDLVMPDMGGQELALRLTERWPTMRVLFTSGYLADPASRQALLRPQDGFLEKPFSPRTLADRVAMILRGSSARAKRPAFRRNA